jgi:hypothetical protein
MLCALIPTGSAEDTLSAIASPLRDPAARRAIFPVSQLCSLIDSNLLSYVVGIPRVAIFRTIVANKPPSDSHCQ